MGYNSAYALSDTECHVHAVPSRQEVIFTDVGIGWRTPVCTSCFYGVHPHGGHAGSDCKVSLHKEDGSPFGQCCCTWRTKEVS